MNRLLKNSHFRVGLLIVSVVLLVGIGYGYFVYQPVQHSECIPPPVQVAYPYGAFRSHEDSNPAPILPPSSWKSQLAEEQLAQIKYFYSARSIVAQGNDIWFTANDTLARYRPATNELTTYTVQVQGYDFLPAQLFVSQDGTIWGSNHYDLSQDVVPHVPGDLSRYDVELDRFEPAPDKDSLLTREAGGTAITEDTQGRLWLIRNWALFSYDPQTRQAERVLDEQQGYRPHNLVGGPDEGVWLAVHLTEYPEDRRPFIIRYDPQTGEINHRGPPPDVHEHDTISSMYFDRSGRLWVENYGWLEFPPTGEPVWYRLLPSPVFITDRMQGAGASQYSWTSSDQVYESSNGLFWFSSGAGLVRFNLQRGEWCLLTTLPNNIVEDADHNLWLAGERQLYKYHLKP